MMFTDVCTDTGQMTVKTWIQAVNYRARRKTWVMLQKGKRKMTRQTGQVSSVKEQEFSEMVETFYKLTGESNFS